MAHHLAEAICELAAPALQPSWIKLEATSTWYQGPGQCLVLHVRPRRLAAGLEVAAYTGWAADEEGALMCLRRRGLLFALPTTDSGLARFAADVLAAGPYDTNDDGDSVGSFVLSQQPTVYPAWKAARCGLFDLAHVSAAALPPDAADGHASGVRFPSPYALPNQGPLPLAAVEVDNSSASYVSFQVTLKENKWKRENPAEAAAAGAAPAVAGFLQAEPDSPAEYERQYRQLQSESMEQLTAALATLLRHAARYPGSVELPPLPPPPAPAAGGAQAGEQAAA